MGDKPIPFAFWYMYEIYNLQIVVNRYQKSVGI